MLWLLSTLYPSGGAIKNLKLGQTVTVGGVSAAITLVAAVAGVVLGGRACPGTSSLSGLAALAFLGLSALAGWMTVRDGGSRGQAAAAGLVVAAISAAGSLVALPIQLTVMSNGNCLDGGDAGLKGLDWLINGAVLVGTAAVASVLGLGIGAAAGAIGGITADQQGMGRKPAGR